MAAMFNSGQRQHVFDNERANVTTLLCSILSLQPQSALEYFKHAKPICQILGPSCMNNFINLNGRGVANRSTSNQALWKE